MEIFIIALCAGLGLGGSIGGLLYLIDPKGWQGTLKRISTLTRASLEASKPVKVLEAKKEDKTVSEWDEEFHGLDKARELEKLPHGVTWTIPESTRIPPGFEFAGQRLNGKLLIRRIAENGPGKGNYVGMELSPAMAVDKENQRRRMLTWSEMLAKADASVTEARVKANLPVAPPVLKHEIVKKDFYNSVSGQGMWPRWTCKCGESQHQPLGIYGIAEAQKKADQYAADHVRSMNESEKRKQETGGKFAW